MNRVITGTELQSLVHNAVSTRFEEDGFLHLYRFTEKQTRQYIADSCTAGGDYGPVTTASANITLDFVTDSAFLGMNFQWIPAVSHPFASFDLIVDGQLWDHMYTENPRFFVHAFPLPGGEHHVQLFLSWNQNIVIRNVILSEGAVLKPAPEKSLRIISYGDSITQGYVGKHPAMNYVALMTRKLNAECLNQAVGGYYFEENSLDEALASRKPDLITIAYGTNDYSLKETEAAFREGAEGFCRRLSEIFPSVPVLAIMPIFRMDERFASRKLLRDYSHETAMNTLREIYAACPQMTVMEDTFFPHCRDFFFTDSLHPNDLGFQIYGEAIVEKIRSMGLC